MCYANHPETIEALKHKIEVTIHGIEAQKIENLHYVKLGKAWL